MNKRILFIVLLSGLPLWLTLGCRPNSATSSENRRSVRYQCSMHPQIVSDKPGTCSICGMKLQKVETAKRKILFYRNPMRPDVTSAEPAKDSMGMDYIPVYEDEAETTVDTGVAGHASFSLSVQRQQLIGVTTSKVKRQNLTADIRAVGKVAYDPELYNAIAEYREAVMAGDKIKESPLQEAHERSEALITSSRLKLRLLGLSERQIDQIVSNPSNPTNLLLPAKTTWVYAQIYEYEIGLVQEGQRVIATVPSVPGREYRGKVVALDPVLNSATRTLRVRAEIETPDESLRPEMFLNVKIAVPLGEHLAVPENAVLNTGESRVVFVKKGEGEFEPRSVQLGRQANGFYEVVSGIHEGEDVVTSANFLIDSESRFRSALTNFSSQPTESSATH